MKRPISHHPQGFTLVELLVVIAIIAVLASAGFAAANAAIQKARKINALATATALEAAVNDFYKDYGYMPMVGEQEGEQQDTVVRTDTDIQFLNVLLGENDELNPRGIRFLSVKEGKGNKNGLIYSKENNIRGLFDPWGGPYHVMMDLDYNEKLDIQPQAAVGPVTLNGRRVAVWSDGADGVDATGKTMDDVKTWGN